MDDAGASAGGGDDGGSGSSGAGSSGGSGTSSSTGGWSGEGGGDEGGDGGGTRLDVPRGTDSGESTGGESCVPSPDPGGSTTGASGDEGTGTTGACNDAVGVCEAAEGDAPCCEDPDCGCDTGSCDGAPCGADGYCDPTCTLDPDCPGARAADERLHQVAPAPAACPEQTEPVVLHMSNDDSNSQASPVLVRGYVKAGLVVPTSAVRIHEFLNYYDLGEKAPADEIAALTIQMRRSPTAPSEFLALVQARSRDVDVEARRPINLVFSLDTSGSMGGLPLLQLKATMRAILGRLRRGDRVSAVTWNTSQQVLVLDRELEGPSDSVVLEVIDALTANGGTDLAAGLDKAYELANVAYDGERINRVVLISDGGANVGETSIDLIAANAEGFEGNGIYLMGIGVGAPAVYRDDLMDAVTDAGKGAYLFIDGDAEAERAFSRHFMANVEVAARDVRMELTLPWYFGIKEFHGEEYSDDPAEVDPQHLGPGDAMSFHNVLSVCDVDRVSSEDRIGARLSYLDPITREPREQSFEASLGVLQRESARQLVEADVVVGYAQAFIHVANLAAENRWSEAAALADRMVEWLEGARRYLDDDEVGEMVTIMREYAEALRRMG